MGWIPKWCPAHFLFLEAGELFELVVDQGSDDYICMRLKEYIYERGFGDTFELNGYDESDESFIEDAMRFINEFIIVGDDFMIGFHPHESGTVMVASHMFFNNW